jgi:hypothetical protein
MSEGGLRKGIKDSVHYVCILCIQIAHLVVVSSRVRERGGFGGCSVYVYSPFPTLGTGEGSAAVLPALLLLRLFVCPWMPTVV